VKKIDTHGHIGFSKYNEEIRKRGWAEHLDKPGEQTMGWEEYVQNQIAHMDKLDIERQVISTGFHTTSHLGDAEFNRYWVQAINDFLAEVCRKYPDRFSAFIDVPLHNVNYAIEEIKRATKAPGIVGITVGSRTADKMLDSPELMPFYEEADKLGLTIFIHPMLPLGFDTIPEYQEFSGLYKFIGFLFNSTMTVTKMVYRGIFEKYQNINLIASHWGGMLPFVHPSIDIQWEQMSIRNMDVPPKQPREYFKKFYVDTARPPTAATLQCAMALFGEDHILFGSDIPNWLGEPNAPKRIISTIEGSGLDTQTEENIFYNNAKMLFNL